jgi:hypothetical protein
MSEPVRLLQWATRCGIKCPSKGLWNLCILVASMQAGSSLAKHARTHYRHELRTLIYVTLDEGNGGIIRNLSNRGVSLQAVAALRPQQRVRLRFELRQPRLRVETYGEVTWAKSSGQCGIRFVELPATIGCLISEWIFGNLLDSISRDETAVNSSFEVAAFESAAASTPAASDGLMLSGAVRSAICLGPEAVSSQLADGRSEAEQTRADVSSAIARDWLAQPLSYRSLARLADSLVVIAAVLLFAVIFVSIAKEIPRWPLVLGIVSGWAVFVATAYWGIFAVFGRGSLGVWLARAVASGFGDEEDESDDAAGRFR